MENKSQRGPREKHSGEQPVRQRFLQSAFYPEFHGNGGVDGEGRKDNREGKQPQSAGNRPNHDKRSCADCHTEQERPVSILPRPEEKENSRAGEESLANGSLNS